MNWIKKGIKEQIKLLKRVESWYFLMLIFGIGYLMQLCFGLSHEAIGIALIVLGVLLFFIGYFPKQKIKGEK